MKKEAAATLLPHQALFDSELCFLLCPAVLKGTGPVEDHVIRSAVFAVNAVVAVPDELEVLSDLRPGCFLLDVGLLDDDEGFGIEVVKVVAGFGTGALSLEELVILPDLCLDAVIDAYPVAGTLNLPSVGSLAAAA